jgi:hypothetical protein
MRGFKEVVFIFTATALSSMVIAKPPSNQSSTAHLGEETKLTAQALEVATADDKLVDAIVPEGARLVDGTEKDEFYIVPKNGAIPKVVTAQTKAAAQAMDEAEEMVNKINVPQLQAALGEKAHEVGTAKQASKAIATAHSQALTPTFAENNVKMPSIQLVESDVTPITDAPATQTAPAAPAKVHAAKKTVEPKKQAHRNSKALHQHNAKHQAKHQTVNATKSMSAAAKPSAKQKPKAITATAKQHPAKVAHTYKVHAYHPNKVAGRHPKTATSKTIAYHHKVFKVKRFADVH